MKTSLLSLAVLFHLIYCSQGDCKAECLTCNNLNKQHEQFGILACSLECEGKIPSSAIWKNCRQIISVSPLLSLKISSSQARNLPFGVARIFGTIDSGNTHAFLQDVKNVVPIGRTEDLDDVTEATFEMINSPQDTEMPSAKRSYDFQAEPLASKPNERSMKMYHDGINVVEDKKSFQKRYGGFMGIRKSARNWSNLIRQRNQKRYSKFLRQYLGLTTRSTNDSLPDNLAA